ncbi:MAG: VOC family protein [Burkholderiales bacterium]|nr:VOC family protein [Burkholderiales bacterium]
MASGIRRMGEFCWINVLTPEPKAARDFFGKLLGWRYAMIPMIGQRIRVDGRDIGMLFDLSSAQTPPGTPPHIGALVKVADADAIAARVTALGGRALPPFDVLFHGRSALCFDVNGAHFGVWQPKAGPGTDVDSDAIGAPGWFDTLTTDVERGQAFYASLFGWTPEVTAADGRAYTVFRSGDVPVAGMYPRPPEKGEVPPHWAAHFTVADVDATARLASELGATIVTPPADVPRVGRSCGIRSPQGVVFYAIRGATP